MPDVKPFRQDAISKVTGRAMYSGDFYMPGMLYAKILWHKYPVAKITKIDTSKAENLPGVEKIITRKDITGPNKAGVFDPYDRPILVGEGEEVKFAADALAIVVAKTEESACEALDHIDVEYEILPGIYTLKDAVRKTEPIHTTEIKRGNVEEAFSKSDVIIEKEFYIPYAEHAYLEPEAGYAYMDELGVINICLGTQNIMRHQRMICKSLGLPYSKIRISVPFMGGGFGGKHAFSIQVYLALAVKILQKPVRLVWSREESMGLGSKRQSIKAKARIGLDKNGKILAIDAELNSPSGPYFGAIHRTLPTAVKYVLGPYWIENMNLKGNAFRTNYSEATAFRGYGATEGTFIIETLIDKAAKKINMSPIDIRKVNLLKENQVGINYPGSGWEVVSGKITVEETLQKVLDAAGPKPKAKEGKKIGRGIAIGMPMYGIGNSPGGYKGTAVDMTLFYDGTINVRIGFPEAGQGITGVVTTLVSEFFNVAEDKISINYVDTHTGPKSGSLGFSQATVMVGNAVLIAAKNLKTKMENTAKEYLHTIENVELKEGNFFIKDKICVDFEEFMDYCYLHDVNMTVTGWFQGPYVPQAKEGITFMSGLVDVEVDEETGEIEVIQSIVCHDLGKAIHPMSARGQLLGGTVMAQGLAMIEEFIYQDGKPVTPSFSEYIIPTAKDIPHKNVGLFVECPGKNCPKGAKGLGEHALYTFPPALVNAVYDAIGISITEIPITPEKILKALNKI
jgi:CO/xanthine dehydrogenase Mo-binding subunit